MESDDVVRYGICKGNIIVSPIHDSSLSKGQDANTLLLGTLVLIVQQIDHKYVAVQVSDWEFRSAIWKDSVWFCPIERILPVDSDIWEFLLAVNSPQERVRLAEDEPLCELLRMLKPGLLVDVIHDDKRMKSVVKYVGPIKDMGPGFFIGIELLGEFRDQGTTNGCHIRRQYFECPEKAGLFVTAADLDLIDYADLRDTNCVDDLIDISARKPSINSKLKLDSHNLRHTLNNLTSRHERADDQIRLLSDWPEKIISDVTPTQLLKTQNRTNEKMNRRNAEMKMNENRVANNQLYSSDYYPQLDSLAPADANKHPGVQRESDEVDLIEILGGQWPAEAGDTIASALAGNVSARINEYERNKSVNPVSHIMHNKKKVNRNSSCTTNRSENVHSKYNNSVHSKSNSINPPLQTKPSQNSTARIYDTPERTQSPPPAATNQNNASSYTNNFSDVESLGLGIGSLVEVTTDVSDPIYGVIRWISPQIPRIVGVELEEDQTHLPIDLTDGTFSGQRHFKCAPGKGLFVPIEQCQVDRRFQELETAKHMDKQNDSVAGRHTDPTNFGQVECPVIQGSVPPLCMQTAAQVEEMCGKYRGIQGHHNSCYLDATLFAMFACTSVFDSLLFRPQSRHDIERYEEVQKVLREEIVNPLRHNLYVRADRVMKLRRLLEDLSSVTGLTSEEKDPEEFLNSLLAQILRAEPFLKLSSGQEAFYYQLFVEKDERLTLPTVQQLFEQSFIASNIKLKEVPSCLIIQMPRFGKSYKMYQRIIPSQVLDVTDIIEDSPRQCTVCGKLAEYECLQCFDPCGEGLEGTAFCDPCRERKHGMSTGRSTHRPTLLNVPSDFREMAEHCPSPPRLYMELFAVVCIETSHYVSFVKCGSGQDAPWCFFDSMADRKGEQNGYNIPEITACPGLASWLGEDAVSSLPSRSPQLPEPARRLLCDAYLCLYQSSDIMMYR